MTSESIFSDMERDVIGEVMNISLGSSATSLSTLLGKRVEITVPKVNAINAAQFSFDGLEPAIGVEISYVDGLDGVNLLILKRDDARSIIEILMGQTIQPEEFEMDEINTSAICEVMNQMMGSAATALADFLGKVINISTPIAYEIEDKSEFKNKYFDDDEIIVTVRFNLHIEGCLESEFINVMPLYMSREIISVFLKGTGFVEEEKDEAKNLSSNIEINYDKIDDNKINDDKINDDKILQMEKPAVEKPAVEKDKRKTENKSTDLNRINQKQKKEVPVNIRPVEYENFDDYEEEPLSQEQYSNLGLIMSVPLEITVEIGKAKRQIKDILEFTQGTIIELDKQAGALVDIIVNGQLIAKGEVVVVNDNFGVRISEIIKKDEIIKLTL